MILDSTVSSAEQVACKKNEKILNERVYSLLLAQGGVLTPNSQINQLNKSITNYETLAQKQHDEAIISLTAQVSQLNTEITKLNQEVSKQTAEALKWSRAHVCVGFVFFVY